MSTNLFKRLASSIVIAPLIILPIHFGNLYFQILLLVILLLGLSEIINLKNILIKFSMLTLFIIFIYSIYHIRKLDTGREYLYLILMITWLSDIGGYIFGKYFKGKKINIISPNKTFIGFVGSYIFSYLSLIYIYKYKLFFFSNFLANSIFVIICCSLVIVGDLLFSFFKRRSFIKDFSNLIPGHGGLFDRIDGLILLTIFLNFFLFNE